MTLDEALAECALGARMRCDEMQPGCYIEHSFKRGFVKCWPVDSADLEWQRTQCDFNATPAETQANWYELEKPMLDRWGKPVVRPVLIPLDELSPSDRAEAEDELAEMTKPSEAKLAVCACGSNIAAAFCCGRVAPKRDVWGRPIA